MEPALTCNSGIRLLALILFSFAAAESLAADASNLGMLAGKPAHLELLEWLARLVVARGLVVEEVPWSSGHRPGAIAVAASTPLLFCSSVSTTWVSSSTVRADPNIRAQSSLANPE